MLDEPIVNKPSFWISGGMLLYCGGVIIINLISESLLKQSEELLRLVFLPQVTLQLCAHLFYLVAFRRGIRRHALLYKGAFV
jgi:hypothetical protein